VQLARDLDVSQAESDESATQVLLRRAQNDVRNGRRTLALLIGADESTARSWRDPGPGDSAPVQDYVDRSLATRQDLLAAQDAVKEARYGVKAAVAEFYPTVSLNVAAYLYEQNYADASKWNGILSPTFRSLTAAPSGRLRTAGQG